MDLSEGSSSQWTLAPPSQESLTLCWTQGRYPAQENIGGDSKIPSIIFYDKGGILRAAGAEALLENIVEQAEDDGWTKLEWWKLHLRPKRLQSSHVSDSDLPPLPHNKTAVEVLSDFMRYLFHCAQIYIIDTHSETLWDSVASNIDFVLTHPNGWEGAQQSDIRRAAVLAGLVPDTLQGHSRLQLLTEGEASLHFCISKGLACDDNKGIIIVDAGGGTVDLSAYRTKTNSASFEEIAPTESKLANSKFGSPEDLKNLVDCFDKSTKLRFRNQEEPSYIKFGGVRDKDTAFGIRSGQLKLPGQLKCVYRSEVAALFEPSVTEILHAVDHQIRIAQEPIKSVFLVGGFAASDWLFSQLQASLSAKGIECCRPDSHVYVFHRVRNHGPILIVLAVRNKAVAEGAVSFYLDHRVSARVARKTYGSRSSTRFKPHDPEHKQRSHATYGTSVSEEKEFRRDFCCTAVKKSDLRKVRGRIRSYDGSSPEPRWTDTEPENFSILCDIEADTSKLSNVLKPKTGRLGKYYSLDYSLVLLFGLTELKAQICWEEKGVEMRSAARVVYDIDETIADV
ncbi:hypothetical protein HWV62_22804 [Athelia sp. TMB]|nr:hypothetical protein HWV62_22804 [Athelia sp. TMB]